MTAIYFNASIDDDQRRAQLYQGDLFVYTANSATRALCALARQMLEEAFAPLDPRDAQHHLPVERYVEILADLKPKFIHHPRCKEMIAEILRALGCDPRQSYFDVPRLRTATSGGYLTSGLGYVFKPHRDVWYSPPMCQLNWWLPVYEITAENAMAFIPAYWDKPIRNSSHEFNYQDWNKRGRKEATTQIKTDTRRQSEALEPLALTPDIRVISEPGGLLIFSAAHLHATVPNNSGQTRLSIDFRTVHLADLAADRGAVNVDSDCTGTTIRDYISGADLNGLPEEICARFEASTKPLDAPHDSDVAGGFTPQTA